MGRRRCAERDGARRPQRKRPDDRKESIGGGSYREASVYATPPRTGASATAARARGCPPDVYSGASNNQGPRGKAESIGASDASQGAGAPDPGAPSREVFGLTRPGIHVATGRREIGISSKNLPDLVLNVTEAVRCIGPHTYAPTLESGHRLTSNLVGSARVIQRRR
jgi:hypothetical protein